MTYKGISRKHCRFKTAPRKMPANLMVSGRVPIFIKKIGGDKTKILYCMTFRYFILGIADIHMVNVSQSFTTGIKQPHLR